MQLYLLNTTEMKKLSITAIFLAFAFWAMGQVPSMQEGIRQLRNENYKAAQDIFSAIAKSDPKNGTVYYYIGEVSYLTEDYNEANKSYNKGLSINPQCAECKVGLGKLMLNQGKVTDAQEMFDSAMRLDKKNPEIFALVGEAYLVSKKQSGEEKNLITTKAAADKAIQYLTEARDMNTKEPRYWALLGDAFKMAGNNGEAMTKYERAVEKYPKNVDAMIKMAGIWKAAKNYPDAINLLKKAIELEPNNAAPYKELVEIYINDGQYDEVTPLLEKYTTLIGDDIDARVRYVKFLTFQSKDYDRAIEEGEKLLKSNPEQYTLHRWLAWAYAEKGMHQQSYDHSKSLFEDVEKKEGRATFTSDYNYWAKSAFKLGETDPAKLDEAAHIYRKYLELDTTRKEEIYGMLAKAYYDKKNYPQAVAYYKRKNEVKQIGLQEMYYLGYSYWLTESDLQADSVFAKAAEMSPEWITPYLMRGKIAATKDTLEPKQYTAREFYEKVLSLASVDKEKNKKNFVEAGNYLGDYWIWQEENKPLREAEELAIGSKFTTEQWRKHILGKAASYFEQVLAVDPTNSRASEYLKQVKEALAHPHRKSGKD